MDTFVCLEPFGIALEDFKTEKAVTYEMLRMARNLSEIAKMYKNAITLLRKDSQANNNLATQIQSRISVYKNDANDSKKKLWELHGVTV